MLQRLSAPSDYLIVDLETTCWYDSERQTLNYRQPEIIEVGAVVSYPTDQYYWRSYVRPRVNTQLSRFCRDLTGATQEDIDAAKELPEVAAEWLNWASQHRPLIFASWGDFDYNVLRREWADHNIGTFPFSMHLNLKRHFALMHDCEEGGLQDACTKLGLPFEGAAHEALNDAKMATKVLRMMYELQEQRER